MKNNSTIQEFCFDRFRLIAVGGFPGGRDVRNHAHNYFEIVYVLDGKCVSRREDDQVGMSAEVGMIYFIPPHVRHEQRGSCETIYMGFELQNALWDKMLVLDIRQDRFMRRWMRDLLELWTLGKHETAHNLAVTIISHLFADLRRHHQLEKNTSVDRMTEALSFIDNNYWKKFTVEDLALYVHCSPSTLNNWFKSQFSKSLMRYVYDFRLSIARQMLNNDYLSLGEIAERCGFDSVNYFIRVFRKHYGITPGELRRQIKGQ